MREQLIAEASLWRSIQDKLGVAIVELLLPAGSRVHENSKILYPRDPVCMNIRKSSIEDRNIDWTFFKISFTSLLSLSYYK